MVVSGGGTEVGPCHSEGPNRTRRHDARRPDECSRSLDSPRTPVLRLDVPSTRPQRPYNVAYYARNRAREIERVVTRQRATVEWLRDLRRVPCPDCGGTFPPHVMDFDHRDPKAKLFSLAADNVYLKNRALLEAEVAKCDIVCANCHRIRTAAQYAGGMLEHLWKPSPTQNATARQLKQRANYLRRRRTQMDVLNRIRGLPCANCRGSFAACSMEFDHRDAPRKIGVLSRMAGRVSIALLLEEIAKCDIVCANCHRDRSFHQRSARGCSTVVMHLPSKQAMRVRFPPPAQTAISEQLRPIEESRAAYRYAA